MFHTDAQAYDIKEYSIVFIEKQCEAVILYKSHAQYLSI